MGRSIRPNTAGIGRYSVNLVLHLAELMPKGSLAVFLPRVPQRRPLGLGVCTVPAPFPTPNEYLRALWEQTVVPVQARSLGLDLYHSPNFVVPAALSLPSVVTIHDLFYLDRTLHSLRNQAYLSVMTWLALRRASGIVAASEYTRRAIERRYPWAAARVEVIYVGTDRILDRPSAAELDAFRARIGVPEHYILSVGTLEPRKNLERLVRAFERLRQESALPHHLVLIGATGWMNDPLERALSRSAYRDCIHRLGFVDDRDLRCWYAGADLFVYPSLKEGFGVPPLEAMTLGAPVVCSNATALPEVVGEAGVTVDPLDVPALADAMRRVLCDPDLAGQLRKAGYAQAGRFDWKETARQHLRLYERTLAAA